MEEGNNMPPLLYFNRNNMYPFNYRQAASPNFGELLTLGCGLYSPAWKSTDASIKTGEMRDRKMDMAIVPMTARI
jgi:hypothetical protein